VRSRIVTEEHPGRLSLVGCMCERAVRKWKRFALHVDSNYSKVINSKVQPELHCIFVNSVLYRFIFPVKVWLLWPKRMKIALLRMFIPRPRTAIKQASSCKENAISLFVVFVGASNIPLSLKVILGFVCC
jgi:hypothetical protein